MARDPFDSSLLRLRTADQTFQRWLASWDLVSGSRQQAAACLDPLPGDTRHKDPGQLAEAIGPAVPYDFQHLPGRAVPWVDWHGTNCWPTQ